MKVPALDPCSGMTVRQRLNSLAKSGYDITALHGDIARAVQAAERYEIERIGAAILGIPESEFTGNPIDVLRGAAARIEYLEECLKKAKGESA